MALWIKKIKIFDPLKELCKIDMTLWIKYLKIIARGGLELITRQRE